jgi:hypothetical protein
MTCRRSAPAASCEASGFDGLYGASYGLAVAGWSGDSSERPRERRHDDAIVRAQEICEPPGGPAHEFHARVHALARIYEQGVSHRQRLDVCQIDRLRLVILEHAERRGVEIADEPAGFVHYGRFEQHSRDASDFDNFEGRKLY